MFTQQVLEDIQLDYGIVYANYGVLGERLLGPIKGGASFKATKTIRDIDYDGKKGKDKGLQVVDDINAVLSAALMCLSMDNLALSMPWATYAAGKISAKTTNIGIIPGSAYLDNITMFAKVVGGGYKKITLYNAMAESDFSLTAAPKSEGTVQLDINAHWDPTDDTSDLFDVEDIASIGADTTPPTVITVPADAATAIVVTSNLTATFNEDIREGDIALANFTLVKATDGVEVAGALSYVPATKTATFNPTASLDASSAYIWFIANVRDLAGNVMAKKVVNFTTA